MGISGRGDRPAVARHGVHLAVVFYHHSWQFTRSNGFSGRAVPGLRRLCLECTAKPVDVGFLTARSWRWNPLGGSIGLSSVGLEQSLLFVYLAFSTLAEAALLHLSLIYPRGTPVRERWWAVLYLPPIFALILAPMVSIIPKTSLQALAGIILLLANLFSIIAAIVFVVRLFMVDAAVRRASHLALIVGIGVSSGVVALLGSEGMLPGNPEAWNLILGVLPVTIAVALVSNDLDSIDSQFGDSHES